MGRGLGPGTVSAGASLGLGNSAPRGKRRRRTLPASAPRTHRQQFSDGNFSALSKAGVSDHTAI